MKTKLSTLIYSLVALFAASSCTDDRIWDDNDIIGDGEATISATIAFKSFDSALDSRTPGDELDGIDNVTILAYNENGDRLIDSRMYSGDALKIDHNNTTAPDNAVNPDKTVPTDKATIKDFSLPYGKYQVYVVANADLTNEDVSTVDKLKGITYTWNSTDIEKNNQMFGWFSTDNNAATAATLKYKHVITINEPNLTLTAWLVRLASKVTVNYDASGLKENVYIFLKSVQVKDIAASCALGVSNTPSEDNNIGLIADGEKILYYEGNEPTGKNDFNPQTYGATLTKSIKDFGSDHAHDANALFFYENNQGGGKDKRQDAVDNNTTGQTPGEIFNPGSGSSDGKIDFPDGNSNADKTGFKDEKRYGTYIEVKAYYRSNNEDRMGEGDITYRFMLGKNTTTNYDAERNYHYKLTLKFNGFANDVDWHIEYEPEPDIYIPNPYYISYIYNKTMTLPVQITGKIKEGTTLRAVIIENDWMPYNYETGEYAPSDQYYSAGSQDYNYTQELWNGFLSLRYTGDITDIAQDKGQTLFTANEFNKNYWESTNRGNREYNTTIGDDQGDASDGLYSVTKPIDGSEDDLVFNIPLYTRAKNLVKSSGYTGNNPYVSFQRKAVVKFTATLWNPEKGDYDDVSKTADIIQVRRVVNPKGVWRAHDESDPFHVHLVRLETEFTTDPYASPGEFKTFTSNGPWSAEVMVEGSYDTKTGNSGSEKWINLTPSAGKSIRQGDMIYGETGTDIEFDYSPKGTIDETKVRYGIIKIRYHNYTCEHLVFVRQGYAPIPISSVSDATKWYTFNMKTQSEMVESPCDEGSLFKRFNWERAIKAENNKENASFQKAPGNLTCWNGTTPEWNWFGTDNTKSEWEAPTVTNEKMRVAKVEDYLQLYNDGDIQYGFGILYDGEADGVQIPVKDAYSYYSDETTGANGKGRGMRGCFVYNKETGAQMFLPIGAAGYGRRRAKQYYHQGGPFYPGELIYGGRDTYMEGSDGLGWYRPILFDLFRRPGAIYWCYKTYKNKETNDRAIATDPDTENTAAWDFNYITFDFYPISIVNTQASNTDTDALRIRCVVDEE